MQTLDVAKTILEQLGGRQFQVMTGAKDFIGDVDTLSFKIGRNAHAINAVRITLDPSETYTVRFFRRGKVVSQHSDIYNDQLRALFTEKTGLYTSFCSR